jgi:hypothetical protein
MPRVVCRLGSRGDIAREKELETAGPAGTGTDADPLAAGLWTGGNDGLSEVQEPRTSNRETISGPRGARCISVLIQDRKLGPF